MNLTPAMKQYVDIKNQYPDYVVLFRMGDFYEMFYEDAKVSARELDIALTARGKGEAEAPLAGIPYHAAEQYIRKFVNKGYKIVLVEQLEDPRQAKGVVKRGIVRIITPGTVVEDSILSTEANNYICAISCEKERYGISFCDISTGEFTATSTDSRLKLFAEIERHQPSELLLPVSFENTDLADEISRRGYIITTHDDRFFWSEQSRSTIKHHFGVSILEGLGLEGRPRCIGASGALLSYLQKTQMNNLGNVNTVHVYSIEEYMVLDSATQRNLELLRNIRDNTTRGTVFEVLNKTKTSMGARTLKNWLLRPLRDRTAIEDRHDAIEELMSEAILQEEIRDILGEVADIERIVGRVTYKNANPRDMVSLRNTLRILPDLQEKLSRYSARLLAQLRELGDLSGLKELLESAIKDEPNSTIREGNIIRPGYDSQLDELRDISSNGRKWISDFEEQERERTQIRNLKVRYNKVFGYFIEVTKPNLHLVPEDYIRKQTQVNSERFITEALKEKESMLLGAQDKINALEYDLFCSVLERVAEHTETIQQVARNVASVDCLLSLAQAAVQHHYNKPTMRDDRTLSITGGRHPVIERIEPRFVDNDTSIGDDSQVHIITGPNMAGKSTYLRQVALITLLAQVGSFVPAESATVGIVDRIFSRVGAYDDLSMGQSTFMVEMSETANILNSATDRSLVIMDEVGRGTSTYDGLSLAWAIVEYIIEHIRAKTLFATHYHHLNKMSSLYSGIKNFNVGVDDADGELTFLHRILPGGTDKSFGIHVAKLAGMPERVIERSQVIMGRIEQQEQLTHTLGDEEQADEPPNGEHKEQQEAPPEPEEKQQETPPRSGQMTLTGF